MKVTWMRVLTAAKIMYKILETSRKNFNLSLTPLIKFKSNTSDSKKLKSRFIATNEFKEMMRSGTTHFSY